MKLEMKCSCLGKRSFKILTCACELTERNHQHTRLAPCTARYKANAQNNILKLSLNDGRFVLSASFSQSQTAPNLSPFKKYFLGVIKYSASVPLSVGRAVGTLQYACAQTCTVCLSVWVHMLSYRTGARARARTERMRMSCPVSSVTLNLPDFH